MHSIVRSHSTSTCFRNWSSSQSTATSSYIKQFRYLRSPHIVYKANALIKPSRCQLRLPHSALDFRGNGRFTALRPRRSANYSNGEPSQEIAEDSESSSESEDGSKGKSEVANDSEVADVESEAADSEGPSKKNFSDVMIRVTAGVVVAAAGGCVLWAGGWWFGVVVALMSYQCIGEYYGFLKGMGSRNRLPLPLRKTASLACLAMVLGSQCGIRSGLFEVACMSLICSLVLIRREKKRIRFSQVTSLVFGLFYCGYLPSFWVRVRALSMPTTLTLPQVPAFLQGILPSGPASVSVEMGLVCTFLPVLCIVAADSFAYLGGRKFGKTPLIRISPKKTVEGAACGCLGSLAVAVWWNWLTGWPGSYLAAVVLGLATFVSSIFGDLIESSMKREAGLKDSGDVIPGHGGLLDRFDSYLFTGMLVYFFWYWYFWIVMGTPLTPLRPSIPTWVY